MATTVAARAALRLRKHEPSRSPKLRCRDARFADVPPVHAKQASRRWLPPRIAQRNGTVEYWGIRARIFAIRAKITVTLELEPLLRPRLLKRHFAVRENDCFGSGIQVCQKITLRSWMRRGKQTVIQPHTGLICVARRYPMDVAFDLVAIRARRSRL